MKIKKVIINLLNEDVNHERKRIDLAVEVNPGASGFSAELEYIGRLTRERFSDEGGNLYYSSHWKFKRYKASDFATARLPDVRIDSTEMDAIVEAVRRLIKGSLPANACVEVRPK